MGIDTIIILLIVAVVVVGAGIFIYEFLPTIEGLLGIGNEAAHLIESTTTLLNNTYDPNTAPPNSGDGKSTWKDAALYDVAGSVVPMYAVGKKVYYGIKDLIDDL